MAEWETRAISERTKSALAELKSKGVGLGYNNPKVRAGLKRRWKAQRKQTAKKKAILKAERAKARADRQAKSKGPTAVAVADLTVIAPIKVLRQQGFSYERIAKALNQAGHKTRRGQRWSQKQVIRVCRRNGL